MGKVAEIGHGFDAVDWIESSDEDTTCFAGTMRGDVEAVVHAVDEVDIDVSGWAEEYCVAGSETAGCVGCRVDEAEVGFDFGDAGGEAFAVEIADEELAEESSGDGVGGAGVEASWEEFRGLVGLWSWAHIFQERESLSATCSVVPGPLEWKRLIGMGGVCGLGVLRLRCSQTARAASLRMTGSLGWVGRKAKAVRR